MKNVKKRNFYETIKNVKRRWIKNVVHKLKQLGLIKQNEIAYSPVKITALIYAWQRLRATALHEIIFRRHAISITEKSFWARVWQVQ